MSRLTISESMAVSQHFLTWGEAQHYSYNIKTKLAKISAQHVDTINRLLGQPDYRPLKWGFRYYTKDNDHTCVELHFLYSADSALITLSIGAIEQAEGIPSD